VVANSALEKSTDYAEYADLKQSVNQRSLWMFSRALMYLAPAETKAVQNPIPEFVRKQRESLSYVRRGSR
jgi:hypothetical protein